MPHSLEAGKLPSALLADLLARHVRTDDPSVIVAPAPGFDAAVVRPGTDIIVKSDPITFATSAPAKYLVAVNANDIACLGGVPRWLSVTALYPLGTTVDEVEATFAQLARACDRIGVSLVGGHTEITPGVERLLLSGTMIGVPGEGGTLTPGRANPGDALWITQAAGIEGTSIIASEMPESALSGLPSTTLEDARRLLDEPGISIVEAARIAYGSGVVTAMHDPTEGGVATAIHELADASRLGFEVDLAAIPIWPVTRRLTDHFDISPLGLISSGALLFAAAPSSDGEIMAAFTSSGIPVARIGLLLEDADERVAIDGGSRSALPRYDADEITRVFARLQAD